VYNCNVSLIVPLAHSTTCNTLYMYITDETKRVVEILSGIQDLSTVPSIGFIVVTGMLMSDAPSGPHANACCTVMINSQFRYS
jgi:hypothetical protein